MDTELADQIKQGQRNVWASGEFGRIADLILSVGRGVVAATEVSDNDLVLDVACGTGNAALPAARAGAHVIGLDLVPTLLEEGRRTAEGEGLDVEWVEGDAEQLPFDDDHFDVVLSTFGCMFAPRHEVAAQEIARVLAPGGRIGIAAWKPEGTIGRFFGLVGSHMPPPPPNVEPPPLWGSEDHVTELFAGTGVEPEFSDGVAEMVFDSPEGALELYSTKFGPMVMAKAALEPQGKWEALADDLLGYYRDESEERDGSYVLAAEYLRTTGGKPG
jgi:ubiquinone/menaquinone biosynthesis C-methylase UbiE